VNWQPASAVGVPQDPSYANLASTVFNGRMWIIHNGDAYQSSLDGTTWVKVSTNPIGVAAQGRGYATLTVYNNQMWYIAGAANYRAPELMGGPTGNATNDVWRSSDGITWTQVVATTPFPARYRHVSFVLGGQLWVFGGRSFVNGVEGPIVDNSYSTTDGLTWTQRNSSELDRTGLAAVVQESNRVTLIGGVQRSFSNRVFQSTNGTSWSEQLPLSFSPQLLASAVSFNGYLWLIGGGRMETIDTNEVWRSADGINWSQVATSGAIFSPRSGHRVLAFNNRLWLIGGYDYFATEGGTPNYFNDVWSSADGVTWTQHPTPPFAARAGHDCVAFNGRIWIVGGSSTGTSFNDVWSSVDGQQWQQATPAAQFLPRVGHRVLALNNQLYVLGGTSGVGSTAGTDEVWRSSDGVTWSQLSGVHFSPRLEHSATVFGNRMYVVGGAPVADAYAAAMYNDVWSSSDGITWQNDVPSAPFAPRRLAWLATHGNEMFLIGGYGVGRTNDVWKSADGTQWRAAFSHDIQSP
jgi:N-acetylneuraminic acid mutarotase